MEIDRETIPSPPSVVQREKNIITDESTSPVDPVAPADYDAPRNLPRNVTSGHKRPAWAHETLEEA
jgi:hypothetical protein